MVCRRTSILDGIDVGVLQARLTAMQMAHLDLTSGAKVQAASYTQAQGSKMVTYTLANIGDLTQAILALQTQIDTLNGQSVNPYDASAAWSTPEMGDWLPQIRSPDAEINQYRDRMVARIRDHVRNDGQASGGVERILDNTVGAHLRLRAKPDYRALAAPPGGRDSTPSGPTSSAAAEALWRLSPSDHGRYNDLERQLTVGSSCAWRCGTSSSTATPGAEPLAARAHRPRRGPLRHRLPGGRPGPVVEPLPGARHKYLRGGIEIDDDGVAIAYHPQGRAERLLQRPRVDDLGARRARGSGRLAPGGPRLRHPARRPAARRLSVFAPVLGRLKMLARYYGLELQQAAIGAALGTYVTSPYDPEQVMDAIGGGEDEQLSAYQQLRADWSDERPAMFNGVKVPSLAPGEDIKTVSAAHPHEGFEAFAHEMQAAGASPSASPSSSSTRTGRR
jgi:capsid protein